MISLIPSNLHTRLDLLENTLQSVWRTFVAREPALLSLSLFLGHSRFRRDALPLMEPVEFLEFHTRKRGERMLRYLLPLSTKVCSPCIYDFNESLSNRLGGNDEFIWMWYAAGCNFNQVNYRGLFSQASCFHCISRLVGETRWDTSQPCFVNEQLARHERKIDHVPLLSAWINHNSAIPREKSSLQGYLIFNFNFDNAMYAGDVYKEKMADRWIKR